MTPFAEKELGFFGVCATVLVLILIMVSWAGYTEHKPATCPNGWNVGEVVTHPTGTRGMIVKCRGNDVRVDTGASEPSMWDNSIVPEFKAGYGFSWGRPQVIEE
jgi:hypothetical protein